MNPLIIVTFITAIISYIVFRLIRSKKLPSLRHSVSFLFFLSFILRIAIAGLVVGSTDVNCFAAWADRIFTLGPGQFYSNNVFTDYPPGYMCILYFVGMLKSFFQLQNFSFAHLVLLKFPAILCDMVTGLLLYKVALKKLSENAAVILSFFYLMNPAVLFNSSHWGQVDSVLTLLIVALCLMLVDGKLLYAYIIYGIGILSKPQMIIFTPLLLLAILRNVILTDFSIRKFFKNLLQGLAVILGMVLACVPFGLIKVISQYVNTLGSYPVSSANAYNFWGLLGLNLKSQYEKFLFFSVKTWGSIAILAIVICTFVLAFKKWSSNTDYFLLGAFIIATMFTFSARMHERYLFPVLALLLFAFLYKATAQIYLCYVLFTITHFLNVAHVLFYYDPYNYDWENPVILFLSVLSVVTVFLFYALTIHSRPLNLFAQESAALTQNDKEQGKTIQQTAKLRHYLQRTSKPSYAPQRSHSFSQIKFVDILLILGIMMIYSFFALRDLGDMYAPQTIYTLEHNMDISLNFGDNRKPAKLLYFMGPTENREFEVLCRDHAENEWQSSEIIKPGTVFTWKEIPLNESAQYMQFKLLGKDVQIIEFCFLDETGNLLLPVNAADYPTLFDEQEMMPEMPSFRNGMYFDEIYHARTAYEYIHNLYS